jgi:hypothetical protein
LKFKLFFFGQGLCPGFRQELVRAPGRLDFPDQALDGFAELGGCTSRVRYQTFEHRQLLQCGMVRLSAESLEQPPGRGRLILAAGLEQLDQQRDARPVDASQLLRVGNGDCGRWVVDEQMDRLSNQVPPTG